MVYDESEETDPFDEDGSDMRLDDLELSGDGHASTALETARHSGDREATPRLFGMYDGQPTICEEM